MRRKRDPIARLALLLDASGALDLSTLDLAIAEVALGGFSTIGVLVVFVVDLNVWTS
jgi:hypothetical protein